TRGAVGAGALTEPVGVRCVAEFARAHASGRLDETNASIPTASLRHSHLPPPRAPWNLLVGFAETFDGYKAGDSPQIETALRQRRLDFLRLGRLDPALTIEDTRACLRQNFAAWRWNGGEPTEDDYRYMWALVERVRSLLTRA